MFDELQNLTPEPCKECGATDDLVAGFRCEQDGDVAHVTPEWTCRRCVRASFRRWASEDAAFWGAQVEASRDSTSRARAVANARAIAATMRDRLATVGAEPDERAAAFLARYAT